MITDTTTGIIIGSAIVLGGLGLIFSFVLSLASRKFAPKKEDIDQKLHEIISALPGFNCGACGYVGCKAYAEAIAAGKAELNLCRPGGANVVKKLEAILQKQSGDAEPKVAQRYCSGGIKEAAIKYEYSGIKNCRAASIVNGGFKKCPFACLGFGDCSRVCPVNAITMEEDGLPHIDKERCTGCERCVKECPKNILALAPKKAKVHVRCLNQEEPKVKVLVCKVGCIACKQCEKACKFDAIHVSDNVAKIDYSKCTNCGACVKVCPRKIIFMD